MLKGMIIGLESLGCKCTKCDETDMTIHFKLNTPNELPTNRIQIARSAFMDLFNLQLIIS